MVTTLDINTPIKKKYKKSDIPPSLVYETLNGKKIYYKNYEAALNGEKKLEEIMASSYLQSLILSILHEYFIINFKNLKGLSNEIGLHISEKNNLGIDLAIFEKSTLKDYPKTAKYLTICPKIVIEVDVKGELDNVNFLNHILEKSRIILNFGAEKVVWILTEAKLTIVAKPNEQWQFYDWDKPFEIIEGHKIILTELFEENNI